MERGDVGLAEAKLDALAELTQQVYVQTIDYWIGLLQFLHGRFQELNLMALAGPRFDQGVARPIRSDIQTSPTCAWN